MLVWLAVDRLEVSHRHRAVYPFVHQDLLPLVLVSLLLAVTATGLLSFTSSLGFWTGWLGELRDPLTLFQAPAAGAAGGSDHVHAYVIYLDGIHTREETHPRLITQFLQMLVRKMGPGVELITNVEPYVVMADGLNASRISGWMWRRLFFFSEYHDSSPVRWLCSFLVQSYNLLRVAISSDRRYGIIYNYEIALAIATQLEKAGFRPGGMARIILLGYSGGGQIAIGVSDYLARICGQSILIITLAGVFSGSQSLRSVDRLVCLQGSADVLSGRVNQLLFPGRSSLLAHSCWNRALRSGKVERLEIARMGHCGRRGPFGDFSEQLTSRIAVRILTWAGAA
ncbi:alpha/beta hydrolase [Cyanobium sp. Morenito 9A2]|uniref:alpha/beta hydrolase n=1 Tax=Cyanobium sp. Morenito 9A2 TaxID=2823718 RepID=UPI0020CEBDA0|nr:alpha/beta hydrolase [Cyanobium sp. Morenito 9A2]MCP9849387.1 alpha/beta hydrolase [Cyanobium sp. Morenito 9A2]